jgi:LysR family hydrogen peroxide-inducible transcriptional activator
MQEVAEIRSSALRSLNPEVGTLRLGIFPTLAPYFLPHAVPRIHRQFPRLETLLIEEKSDALLARLKSGNLDAAILALPVNDDQLKAEFLFEEDFLLAVPDMHPLARRQSLVLRDLDRYDLMLLEEGHCLRDQALDVCRLSGASERTSFRATSLETLRQMVGANVGITLLPELAALYPASGDIRLLRFEGISPNRRIGICWRKGSAMGTFLESITGLLRDVAQELLADIRP